MKHIIIIALFILSSCTKNDNNVIDASGLKGQWIEMESRSDTLSFESWDSLEIMNLKRGKEVKNGFLLPKLGSGPYEYSLSSEIISLKWMLSSNSNPNEYYFKVTNDELEIGNFYNSLNGETLTFEKLK